MNNDVINETNYVLYAAKHYENPQCFDTIEFYEDLNRIKYIKRLLTKYKETGELRERLVVNHIIILFNVFGIEATLKLLFLKLPGYYDCLKAFLLYLDRMPDVMHGIGFNNRTIISSEIEMDSSIYNTLKKL